MIPVPQALMEALEIGQKLGVLDEIVDAAVHLVKGDRIEAVIAAETGAIKAAARAPYRLKEERERQEKGG